MSFPRWLYTVPLRLRSLFRHRQVERELEEELRYHLERRTEEAIAAGMSPEDAGYAALRAMGGLEQRKEECRDARRVNIVHDALQDLRYAGRMLRRGPGFTAFTVLSLALGIGANVAIFGVLNQALLTPPTAFEPDRLAEVELGRARQASFPDFLDLATSGIFPAAAAYSQDQESWSHGERGESVHSWIVTGNYFEMLGVNAGQGRVFTVADASADPLLVVVSHRFWELRMEADPRAVGGAISLNGRPYTLLGILPREFRPLTGPVEVPEVYLPVSAASLGPLDERGRPRVFPIVRLPDGMTHRQAEAALTPLVARLDREYPDPTPRLSKPVRVEGVGSAERLQRHNPELWMLCGALLALSGLVLLIACANVSGLLLVRGVARRREIAMRLAIGASRGRLVRQLVTETLVVALLASGAAVILNVWATTILNRRLMFSTGTVPFELMPDLRLLGYQLGVALLATLLSGLWPALQATRPSLAPALGNDRAGSGQRPSRLRNALVVGQVATSFVLLTVAALFLRSHVVSSRSRLGFDIESTAAATVKLPRDRYAGREQPFMEEAVAKVRALPGVGSASAAALLPLSFATAGAAVRLAENAPETATHTYLNVVGPHYFQTLGIPVLLGREFADQDREGAPAAAIVNQAFARRHSPDSPALGRHLVVADGREPLMVGIVGVVGDARYLWPGEEPRPQVYLSALQTQRVRRVSALVVRTRGSPASAVASLKRTLQGLEPLADVQVTTLRAHVDRAFWPSRIGVGVLGALGALAILLATIGLFGVMSYVVTSSRQSIGVRMALGATRTRVLGLILGNGLKLVGLGASLGLALSLVVPRPLAAFLAAGVTPSDPLSLVAVSLLVAIAGAAASLAPAWRASRLDPMQTLRCE